MEEKSWYMKMIAWREKHIPQRNFIIILSFLVGIFSSLAAFILKSAIHIIQNLLTNSVNYHSVNYWYLIFPIIGITLSYLFVRYIVKDDISHEVTKILYAISQRKSIIKLNNVWSSMVGSVIRLDLVVLWELKHRLY
jgi:CIC family chloride channel protein